MAITGALDTTGRDLLLTRSIPAPAHRVWAHLTRPSLLAAWFGTFTGDPAEGSIRVTMTAEPGEATASEYTIHACKRERLLTVSSAMGEDTWRIGLELEAGPDGAQADGAEVTRVVLRHHDAPAEMLASVGPGWEWYLDRLHGAVTGDEIPGMDVWDSRYMTLSAEYAALAP